MQLTYLAHASLLVESGPPGAGGVRLVTDPWLDGPTYLSAWWHFPEPAVRGADLRADFIYLTHEHVDHFHVPTLARVPRATPILIGRFLTPRFRRRLEALGFTDVRELPHGREVALGGAGLRVTSFQYRADDTALLIRDKSATVLNLNDCLLRGRSLDAVLAQAGRVDLLCASFANAEGYPIVYDFEDEAERADWDDAARFDGFLEKVRRIAPGAFTPFASMFCFLDEELFPINARIVSPAGLIDRAAAGEVAARPLAMNPGDTWDPERGHTVRSAVDWSRKAEILEEYRRRHAVEIRARRDAEVVPGGREAFAAAFARCYTDFARRLPWVLARRLDLRLRFDVEGPAGGTHWLRFSRGRLSLEAPASDDAWDVRVRTRDWPLWRALTRVDDWQTFGISCRFHVSLRRGARPREVYFWFLLYLDDLGYLSPLAFAAPRAMEVMARRHREVAEYARSLATGRFVDSNLRGKFDAG